MTLSELERAAHAAAELKQARAHSDALAEFAVIGMIVAKNLGMGNYGGGTRIERGGNSGTDDLASLHMSKEMIGALTHALHKVLENRIGVLQCQLAELGVDDR